METCVGRRSDELRHVWAGRAVDVTRGTKGDRTLWDTVPRLGA